MDSFSAQPAIGQPETGERTSDSLEPVSSQSNVVTFPGACAPSNVRPVNLSFDYRPALVGAESEPWRQRANMHTHVFRSYDLIVTSPEADLLRDVRHDLDKARTKLKRVQKQLELDREHAAARADLLTKAEARLSAAIVAAAPVRSVER
jgi:sugar/nucleoside kinase (ribokinase family)